MPWKRLTPANQGGGRQSGTPAGKLYDSGQFTLNHAAVRLLGDPAKVLIDINVDEHKLRLTPTTPDSRGGFALSGGGNSSHRIGLRQVASEHSEMVGEYSVVRVAGGIECRRKED